MGRLVIAGAGAFVLGVILWLELGQSYKEQAEELRATKAEIEERGTALSTWADELDEQEANLSKRETTLQETAGEIEKRKAALKKLETELEKRTQSAVQATAPPIVGKYAVVIDADTGIALYEKNADSKTPVASTQKLMTGLLVAEAGELDAVVKVERPDTLVEPTKLYIKPGEEYERRDLLEALLVKSGNDLAMCLARDYAGSAPAFAKKMNEKALELGMTHSHFLNPHGLPANGQYSTARDMAKLAVEVYENPILRKIVNTPRTIFEMGDGTEKTLINTNRVLRECSLCNGMKTGYTRASGHCLICSGESGGKRRIVVLLGSDRGSVYKDSRALLEWALDA